MKYETLCEQQYVSRETYAKLCTFAELVAKWQRSINLISPSSAPYLWERHILDSLQLIEHLPETPSTIYDIGSGGGFPAIPLALATNHSFHLIESDQRKSEFLKEVVRQTGLQAKVHTERVETLNLSAAPIIMARACAPLSKLLAWSRPCLSPESKCLFPKGANYRKEIEDALLEWCFDYEVIPSRTDQASAILCISNLNARKT